jgi:hypothetical protein
MPRHSETRHLPYTPEQMFELVADVARYDEFLPWVVAVRVRSSSEAETVADLVVGFSAFKERFTSRVTKQRAERIVVDSSKARSNISRMSGGSNRPTEAGPTFSSRSISPSSRGCSNRLPGRCSIGRCGE